MEHSMTQSGLGAAVVIHPLDPQDASTIDRIRAAVRAQKGVPWRIEARQPYDALLESVPAPDDVTFEPGTVGDVSGVWVHPASSRPDALVLASCVSAKEVTAKAILTGVAALSPVTDLTLSGASYETRSQTDPFFTRQQVAELVRSYLGSVDANDPRASPLQGRLAGIPPIRIHVGDDEVLLDDSRRYVERAVAARVDARLDVWTGMPHGFVASIGAVKAAAAALDAIGMFLMERLQADVDLPGSGS